MDKGSVSEKRTAIHVGKEVFFAKAMVCNECGRYALTKEIRIELDNWGKSLKKNVIEPQPILSRTMHEFLVETASKYGIKEVPLIKVMTSFYLNHIVTRTDYSELENFLKDQESYALMMKGNKSKISVPIHYLTYKKLQTYCEIWKTTHAKSIEIAVIFCVGLLTYRDTKRLREIAESLEQFVEDYALAA